MAASASFGATSSTLYAAAAEGIDVTPTVGDAVTWANAFIHRIAAS